MRSKKAKIRRLAYKVRAAVERLAAYEAENYEGENCPITLCGLCARASALLSYELSKANINHKIAYCDYGHVYIRWQNYVVDITATQFGNFFGKTMIRPYDGIYELCAKNGHESTSCYWRTTKTFCDIDSLIAFQHNSGWPDEQTVCPDDLSYLEE